MTTRDTEPLPVAPYSLDVLSDLHAGVFPEAVSEKLWPRVRADESAMTVIAALDAVSTRLGDAGSDLVSGEVMPPEVAERIDRALANENIPVIEHRRPARKPVRFFAFAAAALILVAVAATVAVRAISSSAPTTTAASGGHSQVLTLESDDIDANAVHSVMERRDPVPLIDEGLLPDCLEANGIGRNTTVLGAAPVDIDGRSGTMLILSRFPADGTTVLAVGSDCGVGDPQQLFRRDLD